MSNIYQHNFHNCKLRLSNSDYWDHFISYDCKGSGLNHDAILSGDCLNIDIDINEDLSYSGNTLYSLKSWTGSTIQGSGVTLNDIGLTGIDNGFINYTCSADTTGSTFINTYTGSTLFLSSADTRFFMTQITGCNYSYGVSIVNGLDEGRFAKLCGGFYQGFFKLSDRTFFVPKDDNKFTWEPADFCLEDPMSGNTASGTPYNYQVLPTRYEKGWTSEFWLKKNDTIECERPEILTGLTVTGTSEIITILVDHGLTTDDVVSVKGGGEPFDLVESSPFYKVTNIIDDDTFVYGVREISGSLTASTSDIAYIGRFTEISEVTGVTFTHLNPIGPIANPFRFFGNLTNHSFTVGDMLSFDIISRGFTLDNHYTAYVTDIINDDYFEVWFGNSDPINGESEFTANLTRFIESGCNVDYDIYPNISMVKEYSGNTVTVTLPNHDMVTGDTFSIFNSTTAFTTTYRTSQISLNEPITNSFGFVTNIVDENNFEFTHPYFNLVSGLTGTGTVLLYEEDITVDDVDIVNSTGSPIITSNYELECENGLIKQPIKVSNLKNILTPAYYFYDENGQTPYDRTELITGYGDIIYTETPSTDNVRWWSVVGISQPFPSTTSITFYKPKKRIPLKLNDVYPDNRGMFFYMGTRAENKFWNVFSGETGYTTSSGIDLSPPSVTATTLTDNPFLVYSEPTTACTFTGVVTTVTRERDRNADIIQNALGFRIKDDCSIGYRYLTVSGECSGNTYVTGTTIEEDYSDSNIVTSGWTQVVVRFTAYNTLTDCDLVNGGRRKGRLDFFINGYLKYSVEDFDEFLFRDLNEHREKQQGVPFNYSFGGGTQGLIESQTIGGPDLEDETLVIEENFAGTFEGCASIFRLYGCSLDVTTIRHRFESLRDRFGI
jgi:hypothetical protein